MKYCALLQMEDKKKKTLRTKGGNEVIIYHYTYNIFSGETMNCCDLVLQFNFNDTPHCLK